MALFGSRKPKLPSYVDVSLDGLRADPMWAEAIKMAGMDLDQCEMVVRVDHAAVAEEDVPDTAEPALVLGRGETIAIAYPGEREIKVVTRPKDRAELQTQRSGYFQIVFGDVRRMDVWMFMPLQRDTTEGDRFGHTVLAFLRGSRAQGSAIAGATTAKAIDPATLHVLPEITPALTAQAREFMDEWTHIVGQASDPVFYGALARFGSLGGGIQGPDLLALDSDHFEAAFARPWNTWIGIGKKANESGDCELPTQVFLFAWAVANQVNFDADLIVSCGYASPPEELYQEIARQALAAVNRAPDDFSIVERSNKPPVTKQGLTVGINQLLGISS